MRHRIRNEHRHSIDVYVGARIRLRRTLLGMSQEKLGDAIGLTFQQVQKYEGGANRVSAGMLAELTRILDVPITYFFERSPASDRATPSTQDDHLMRRETLELVRVYYTLHPMERYALVQLVKSMAHSRAQPKVAE